MVKIAQDKRVVIIGAGIGGLTTAISLRRKLGFENFTIIEKADDVGGTWRDNTYPGAGSDVEVHLYSLSTDLKPDWATHHATQPDIHAYWRDLATKYDLWRRCRFNTRVVSVNWDASAQLYHVTIEDEKTRTESVVDAEVVVSCTGILEQPRYPDIEGVDNFKGEMMHSARWNHQINLAGKRVGVVGNGSSATQFVPRITKDGSTEVTQFMRTPSWYAYVPQAHYSSVSKWAFANVPGFMRAYRNYLYFTRESIYVALFSAKFLNKLTTQEMKDHLIATCPKEYLDQMMPKHPAGCKRLMVDSGYLASLARPNVTPNFDGIQRITENGIQTKTGDIVPCDAIIFATGFSTDRYPFPVHGANGASIQGYYDAQKGPTAYKGTTVPGLPNFYMVCGPNTLTGHTSAIFTEEVQIDYILKMVEPVLAGKAKSFEVTTEAADKYNAHLARRLDGSPLTACVSWYRTGGNGKVTGVFPGSVSLYWWWMRKPEWNCYKAVGAEKFEAERKWESVKSAGKVALFAAAAAGLWQNQSAVKSLVDSLPIAESVSLIREKVLQTVGVAL